MDNFLSMVGLALRAGRLEAGDDAVADACREKRCRLLLTASDASENALRRSERAAQAGQCLTLPLPCSKEELGAALGRGSCAVAAVTDLGFALGLAEKLAARDPDRYGGAVERMRLKAERAAQRRQSPAKRPKRKKK